MNPINSPGTPNNPVPPSELPPAGQQGASVWPPPPAGTTPYGYVEENTSGMNSSVPPEIAALKWNWGAALLPFWWTLNHRLVWWGVGILVLSFIPYLGYVISIAALVYFGINGHKLAWQNRRFDGGLMQYFAVQKAWLNWGVGMFVVSVLLTPLLAAVLFPVFAKARAKARASSGYTGRVMELPPPAHKTAPSR